MRYHQTPVEMNKFKTDIIKRWRNRNSHPLLIRMQNRSYFGKQLLLLLACDSAIVPFGI
jgi:hypothetical protein